MKITELLMKGHSFPALLKTFGIDGTDVKIQDEDMIMADQFSKHQDIIKESICIEAKNKSGVFNLFGTLHCNLVNNLAVFEMQGFEQLRQLC